METSGNYRTLSFGGVADMKGYILLDDLGGTSTSIRVSRVIYGSKGDVTLQPIGQVGTHSAADEIAKADAGSRNIWGTPKDEVDEEWFCAECERTLPSHYESCPLFVKG